MESLFQNTLSSWQWGLLALVPPAIIALYFLKLRRVPLEIPSTYLWQRAIEDLHVNSFWQRLRKNLLLLLQLLILALAMFALLRPGWHGTSLQGERIVFLIDNSASMSATDVSGGATRLDEAKRHVHSLIDQLRSGMSAMIISFADVPSVVQEFTDNRRLLHDRLDTVNSTSRPTDLRGALELASGLANPARMIVEEEGMEFEITDQVDAAVYIFTDGRFAEVEGFSLGNLQPIYVPIGTADAENVAVTAFSTRRNEARPESQQVFAQVTAFTSAPQTLSLELYLNDEFIDAREVRVNAGESSGAVFPIGPGRLGDLRLEVSSAASDDRLPLDDVAYAPLNDIRPGRVLVITPGNDWLATVLSTDRAQLIAQVETAAPEILDKPEYRRLTESAVYDLVVFDQCSPSTPELMPRANSLFIGQLPPIERWQNTEQPAAIAGLQILVWNQEHPLMADVEMGNVQLVESFILDPPAGSTSLIESTRGLIAAIAPREGFEDAVLGFEIVGVDEQGQARFNTNWQLRHSFPTFWLNALEYFAASGNQAAVGSVRPGRPIELRPITAANRLEITLPQGGVRSIDRDPHGVFQFQETSVPGNYVVRNSERVIERFAVNLFDRAESDIRVLESEDVDNQQSATSMIRIGLTDVVGQRDAAPERKELWTWLLLGALAVLLFEWYIYNRRVYI